jgi:hypothetical protein
MRTLLILFVGFAILIGALAQNGSKEGDELQTADLNKIIAESDRAIELNPKDAKAFAAQKLRDVIEGVSAAAEATARQPRKPSGLEVRGLRSR